MHADSGGPESVLKRNVTTTTALLHALRSSRDAATWNAFSMRYSPILHAVARRIGLNDDDAADVAQQTLFEVVRDMRDGKYDAKRGRLRSWIVAIAEHRSRDLQRSARRRAGMSDELRERQAALASTGGTAWLEAVWDEEERAHIAVRAWNELSTEGRMNPRSLKAFELVAMRRVPAHEAAAECAMSIETLYSAKYRVAERLKEIVTRLTVEYEDAAP